MRNLFEQNSDKSEIRQIAWRILGNKDEKDFRQLCLRYGESPDEVRCYDVYKFSYQGRTLVLKKGNNQEVNCYENHLKGKAFHVPEYYGSLRNGEDIWFVMAFLDGCELSSMTDSLALAAADTVAQVQNAFWNSADTPRMDVYRQKINKRYDFVKNEPVLGEAYRMFAERQEYIPRTLCQGDFLQINAISKDGTVYMIDWGSGGILPYALDIARFIAHGTEKQETFPITMNDKQKGLFVRRMYELLEKKPDYQRYLLDIRLAVLNEYVEFVAADEDDDGWYMGHAKALAGEICKTPVR